MFSSIAFSFSSISFSMSASASMFLKLRTVGSSYSSESLLRLPKKMFIGKANIDFCDGQQESKDSVWPPCLAKYWLAKPKEETHCWWLPIIKFWVWFVLWFILRFHELNLVHCPTLCTTNWMIFVPKWMWFPWNTYPSSTSIFWKPNWEIDSSTHENQDGWNTSVMLAFHAVINPLTSLKGSVYGGGLSPVNVNAFMKRRCDIQASHRYRGVEENLLGTSFVPKSRTRCFRKMTSRYLYKVSLLQLILYIICHFINNKSKI